MTHPAHEHPTVFVGNLEGELGGTYPLYWCRDCGTLFEMLGSQVATLVPTLAEDYRGAKIQFVPEKPRPRKAPGKVLGRGLVEIMAGAPVMRKLPGA